MPPRKTTRKPAAKKTTARKPAAKRPASKPRRNYRKKKADKRLPIGMLIAFVPAILLAAFILLRFSGGERTAAPQPAPAPETVEKTIVEEVEKTSVTDTVKLFLFEKGLKSDSLNIQGSALTISAKNAKSADRLSAELKKYLYKHRITVDGGKILSAEDTEGLYTISFTYPEPGEKQIPKVTQKPVKKPAPVKPVKFKAKMAVVIDDCGYNIPLAKQLAGIDYPVTFAVLPFTPYGVETAKIARGAGKTLFIHFPMQPKSYPDFDPGKGALFLNMPESLISAVTKANFEYFPMKLDGANNHTGSAFTESREKMHQALRQIKKYVPAFLDSHTSGSSAAYEVCQDEGMRCAENNIFLDNEEPGLVTISDKKNHVHSQLIHAAKRALANGNIIAIGHLKKETVSVLNSTMAEIEKMGVQIVPVTSLMK